MNCRPHAVRSRRDRARRICAKSPEMCADRVRQKESERQVQMLEAMLESNGVVRRMCYVRTSCGCSFRPTRAVGVQELMLVHSAGSTAKKWCGRWPRILRKLPSGACGGQFNGTLSTLGYEAQRGAGAPHATSVDTSKPRPAKAFWLCKMRVADAHSPKSKIFRSDACGGQFSIWQAAEWHNVTSSDSCG